MLKKLRLQNIALIDQAEIEFDDGLNVLSGETGAGKSVILDSINFVLGAKADKTMIRYGTQECLVEAEFLSNDEANKILSEYDIESDESLIIKRKFSIDGKGYIKINGETVTSGMLRKVTAHLVDVHGQSEHYELCKESSQLEVVDKYAGTEILSIKEKLIPFIKEVKEIQTKLKEFGGSESERAIKLDVLKFQINEIESADIKEGEEDELLSLKEKIKNGEKIVNSLSGAKSALIDDGEGIDCVVNAQRFIYQISGLSEEYLDISNRLDAVVEELNDIDSLIDDLSDDLDFDEKTADEVEERLDTYKILKKKYGNSYEKIQNFYYEAQKECEMLLNFEENTKALNAEKENLDDKIYGLYKELNSARQKAAKDFSEKVVAQLTTLGMKNARFDVSFKDLPSKEDMTYNANGIDGVEFLFSANLGEPLKPMSKVISGGEMSRFMLGMKSVICDLQDISTFIFDEIDTGISGKIAQTVAEKFARISLNKQIIAISHLPQICAMSDVSFLIYKHEKGEKTYTEVKKLNDDEKIYEILRLIGGNGESIYAKQHAEEMIKSANDFKKSIKHK